MQLKTSVRAGGVKLNHNERLGRSGGVQVKTSVRAGGISLNHNERLVHGRA